MTASIFYEQVRPSWERLAEHREVGGNMILFGVVGIAVSLAIALMGELSPELGGPWPVVAFGVGGLAFVVLGRELRKRAIEGLRRLPVAERRKAIAYIQGDYQLRQELDIQE
jgi:hypothetical protein